MNDEIKNLFTNFPQIEVIYFNILANYSVSVYAINKIPLLAHSAKEETQSALVELDITITDLEQIKSTIQTNLNSFPALTLFSYGFLRGMSSGFLALRADGLKIINTKKWAKNPEQQ